MSQPTVARICKAFAQTLAGGNVQAVEDPLFVDKVRDIVALHMNPPERAAVMCVDEKTAVQALDRTQPVLPLLPHTPERMTHDYKRHGTVDLFATLNLTSRLVTHQLTPRHHAVEFRKFLDLLDNTIPAELTVHIVSTTPPPTRPRPYNDGWSAIHASSFTSRPPPRTHESRSVEGKGETRFLSP